jgi:CMP-N-acetylneuraminic acid synthetase
MTNASVWAVIPARGGSKSIPCKNLAEVGGVPLIARAIRVCLAAKTIGRTIVTTDDDAIAGLAKEEGAEVVFRPKHLSGDTARSEDALLHVLDILAPSPEMLPGCLVFVQCTSPFIAGADIDGAVDALVAHNADCALTVTRHHGFLWTQTAAGSATGINHDLAERPRRQDRTPEFLETGAVYVMRTEGFRTVRHRFFGKVAMYEVPQSRAMEIDEPADLVRARLMAPWVDSHDSSLCCGSTEHTAAPNFNHLISKEKKAFLTG